MNNDFVEQYYERVVLPLYRDNLSLEGIRWKDHGKVGLDAWAHYFDDKSGREYVLLYEDFPGGDYLNDDLSHDLVKCGEETSVKVGTEPDSTVENLVGYFTLYAEKLRRGR